MHWQSDLAFAPTVVVELGGHGIGRLWYHIWVMHGVIHGNGVAMMPMGNDKSTEIIYILVMYIIYIRKAFIFESQPQRRDFVNLNQKLHERFHAFSNEQLRRASD